MRTAANVFGIPSIPIPLVIALRTTAPASRQVVTGLAALLWPLLWLGFSGSTVLAAPNSGGVLVVHSANLVYTIDTSTYIGLSGIACGQDVPPCPPYDPVDGANPCTISATNPTSTQPADAMQVWYVLAAFPSTTCPRLKAVGFGFQYNERWNPGNPTGRITIVGSGGADPDDPGLVFELPEGSREDSRAFPATGASLALSFTTPRTSHLQELYWFAGYVYSDGTGDTKFELLPHTRPENAKFVDDSVPPELNAINGYGVLGFNGTAGSNPEPVRTWACCSYDDYGCRNLTEADCLAQNGFIRADICDAEPPNESCCGVVDMCFGACCLGDGVCLMVAEELCADLAGNWLGTEVDVSCRPSICAGPLGACCFSQWDCSLQSQSGCTQAGGEFLGEGQTCDPEQCRRAPIESSSWGKIKVKFR